jgi:hypothetical protein
LDFSEDSYQLPSRRRACQPSALFFLPLCFPFTPGQEFFDVALTVKNPVTDFKKANPLCLTVTPQRESICDARNEAQLQDVIFGPSLLS